MGKFLLVVGLALATMSSAANASFLVEVRDTDGDPTTQNVPQGGSVQLLVNLSEDPATFDTFKIFLTQSIAGLILDDYDFSPDILPKIFVAKGPSDSSGPKAGVINDGFAELTGYDPFQAEVSSGFKGPQAAAGTLIVLNLTVPGDFPVGPVHINTNSIFINNGFFFPNNGVAGTDYVLNVTPEPVTLALLGVGGLVGVMRRRRR